MKVYKGRTTLGSLEECKRVYDKKVVKSRTSVGGTKAVRLNHLSMRYSTLRPDNGGFTVRFHNTDIVHYSADGYVKVTLHGWTTRTTLERVYQACGFRTYECPNTISDQNIRVYMAGDAREGKASQFLRRTMPFIEGLRVNAESFEVHPEDVVRIPTEKRKLYETVSKETRKAFSEKWSAIADKMKFSIGLGAWADDIVKVHEEKQKTCGHTLWRVAPPQALPFASSVRTIARDMDGLLDEFSDAQLYCAFMAHLRAHKLGKPGDTEGITAYLKKALPGFRTAVQEEFARLQSDGFETKGGQILAGGYFVNEGEKDDQA